MVHIRRETSLTSAACEVVSYVALCSSIERIAVFYFTSRPLEDVTNKDLANIREVAL